MSKKPESNVRLYEYLLPFGAIVYGQRVINAVNKAGEVHPHEFYDNNTEGPKWREGFNSVRKVNGLVTLAEVGAVLTSAFLFS